MEQEKTYKWIQDRIRELHAGTITADDRRQLNALAQDDPFVADALEGFQAHPKTPHEQYLKSLVTRIKPLQRQRRRWLIPNLTVTAVAASLMLIVGFWAVMNRLSKEDQQDFAAMETEQTIHIDGTPDSTILSIAEEALSPTDEIASAEKIETKKDETKYNNPRRSTSRQEEKKEIAVLSEPEKIYDVDQDASANASDEAIAPLQAGAIESTEIAVDAKPELKKQLLDPGYYANQMDQNLMNRRATGRVISPQGDPLIGANLMIRGTNLGTESDLNGQFELFLPTTESVVDITYSGYGGTETVLKQGEENVQISLPEANSPSEYMLNQSEQTLSKSGATQKKDIDAISRDAQILFMEYLRKNSKFPLKDNLYTPGKLVMLTFSVSLTGDPQQIEVTESSGDIALDQEAVRLIRKGPKWTCAQEAYPCAMRYTIYFR